MSEKRPCPVCGTSWRDASVFLEGNYDPAKLNEFSYSSRKTPEYMNLALVPCPTCDLVYANDPPTREDLANAYHVADYDSSEEADDAATAYVRAIAPMFAGAEAEGCGPRDRDRDRSSAGAAAALGFTELVGSSRPRPPSTRRRPTGASGSARACSRRRTSHRSHST